MFVDKKGSRNSPEVISWAYHARELQIWAITEQVRRGLIKKITAQSNDIRALNHILATPPIFVSDDKRHSLSNGAMRGVRLTHTTETVTSVFKQLQKAITPEAQKVTSIVFGVESSLIEAFEAAFPEKDLLYAALVEGEKEAGGIILASLQGDQPLLRFRKDMLKRRLKSSVDGGSFAFLSTKVPRIEVRYYYPPGHNFPILSLEVKRLDQV